MKYRKKPVVIEAFEMSFDNMQTLELWPGWLRDAWEKPCTEKGAFYIRHHTGGQFAINTLEGEHLVNDGDFIIQGVQGEIYPCKPDIFAATYEAVEL